MLHSFACELAVLSACESGVGRAYAAEGLLGLGHAFLLAGARQVLVSLWKVDDVATAALMRAFYKRWHASDPSQRMTAGAALREAQREIRASNPRWAHEHYWAAWVLWEGGMR